jgi:hypothetical protein
MAALIEFRTANGVVGYCDNRCYDAPPPPCVCICNGANHGVGLQQALQNVWSLAERWIEDWKRQNPGGDAFITDEARRLTSL